MSQILDSFRHGENSNSPENPPAYGALSTSGQPSDNERATVPAGVLSLTPLERAVCSLMAQGDVNRRIARVLAVSLRRIEQCRHDATERLGLRNSMFLLVWAVENRHYLPDVGVDQPAKTMPAAASRFYLRQPNDPTPDEIAERSAALREGGEPCSA